MPSGRGMEMLPAMKAAVLMAVIRQERPTVRTVMKAVGLTSTSTAHAHLEWLRAAGLIEWTDGRHATLRSTLTVAAMDRSLLPAPATTPSSSRTPAG